MQEMDAASEENLPVAHGMQETEPVLLELDQPVGQLLHDVERSIF